MSDKSAKETLLHIRRKKIVTDKVEASRTPEEAKQWLEVGAKWDENDIQSDIQRRDAERKHKKAEMRDVLYGVYSFGISGRSRFIADMPRTRTNSAPDIQASALKCASGADSRYAHACETCRAAQICDEHA